MCDFNTPDPPEPVVVPAPPPPPPPPVTAAGTSRLQLTPKRRSATPASSRGITGLRRDLSIPAQRSGLNIPR